MLGHYGGYLYHKWSLPFGECFERPLYVFLGDFCAGDSEGLDGMVAGAGNLSEYGSNHIRSSNSRTLTYLLPISLYLFEESM